MKIEALNRKLAELTDEETEQVTGGIIVPTNTLEMWLREVIDN